MIDWTAFVPAACALSLIPGPNQLLSARNAVCYGVAAAAFALLARFAVFAMMAIAVASGLGTVLTHSAVAFVIVKWAGAVYLIYLGLRLLWCARGELGTNDRAIEREVLPLRIRVWRAMRQEVVVAATNPKAMLLFAAFLPQFLTSDIDCGGLLLILAAAYIGIEAVSAVGYTVLGGLLGTLAMTARAHRSLDRLTGTAFIGFGGYLATAQRA
ncbi:LysE family translocator [Nocardia sp. NPDC050712]|uniref:LysE family translocator n=1 Tax=Nocardia sp. NPDC050712 TaxID=3155518 RepID=UPI0033C7A838